MGISAEVYSYVQTLAWPSVAVAGLSIFRRQIKDLIPRVSEISAAGASVKFGEEAMKLAREASSLAEDMMEEVPSSRHLPRPPRAVDPVRIFLEGYGELESAARDAATAAGMRYQQPNPAQVIRRLAASNEAPRESAAMAEELHRIRNEVTRGVRQLEATDAENLANAARSLALICSVAILKADAPV